MCGFAGFWRIGGVQAEDTDDVLKAMAARIAHRGPDGQGLWRDAGAGISMAFRRLAILDLSPAGDQPMQSASGRYVLTFNGEIYNHPELRLELEARGVRVWRGHSDTEVLLAAIEEWGIEAALRRTIGMFGFALWDKEQRSLTLARDRMGEKPVYYGWQNGVLFFGSELKAFKSHPSYAPLVNRDALTLLFRHGYIPAPHTIYNGMYKLPPATYVRLNRGAAESKPTEYWSLAVAASNGRANPFRGSQDEAAAKLEQVLANAIRHQMVADVPLGAFLSGGVDSSTVVALMQRQATRPVRTFTVGFREERYDEAEHARRVAEHIGTDHTELYVSAADAMAVVPTLPSMYDEPFSDSSQIPTHMIARLARQHVTVALTGDAGDELFGGYERYRLTGALWRWVERVPSHLRPLVANLLSAMPVSVGTQIGRLAAPLAPWARRDRPWGSRLRRAAEIIRSADPATLYRDVLSHWKQPGDIVLGATEPPGSKWPASVVELEQQMMFTDSLDYLPNDVLVKVDRAAMATSLETRVPLLDHRVIEFAWTLPLTMKRDGKTGKRVLKDVLRRHVPEALFDRPKMGFGVPIGDWLRGPLREWAEALLGESRLRSEGYLRAEPIREKWLQHVSGSADWQYHLWDVLMFQQWLEHEARAESP